MQHLWGAEPSWAHLPIRSRGWGGGGVAGKQQPLEWPGIRVQGPRTGPTGALQGPEPQAPARKVGEERIGLPSKSSQPPGQVLWGWWAPGRAEMGKAECPLGRESWG